MMELGISSYTFTWAMGIKGYDYSPVMNHYDLIKKTKGLGVNLLQIADNAPLHELNSEELQDLAQFANSQDIFIEIAAKGLTEDAVKQYVQLCKLFNCNLLRFIIDDASVSYEPNLSEIISLCQNLVPLLQDASIRLAIENHDRFKAVEFKQIIQEVNSKYVGICLDCANSLGAGEGIFETTNTLSPYTINLHLKDISITRKMHMMGFDVLGVPFGQGLIPLDWMRSKMPSACQTAILESWVPPENTIEETIRKEEKWAVQGIKFIKTSR